jgi:hypothetical protein
LCATENWVKFIILLDGNLRLMLSVMEGHNFDDKKGKSVIMMSTKVGNFRGSKALV